MPDQDALHNVMLPALIGGDRTPMRTQARDRSP